MSMKVFTCGLLLAGLAFGQSRLADIGSVYVDQLGDAPGAAGLREQLLDSLFNVAHLQATEKRDQSDGALVGRGSVTQAQRMLYLNRGIYQGSGAVGGTVYDVGLALRLVNRAGTVLWAYDPAKRCGKDDGVVACAVKQLAKAIEEDTRARRRGR
jgi:hypothetical protein